MGKTIRRLGEQADGKSKRKKIKAKDVEQN